MRLKVILPTSVPIDAAIVKVIMETENGLRCLLPRHIDCAAPLVRQDQIMRREGAVIAAPRYGPERDSASGLGRMLNPVSIAASGRRL